MKLLYLAPLASRPGAAAAETRLAAEDGHRVLLLAEGGPKWEGRDLDPRIETVWLDTFSMNAAEPLLISLCRRRIPLGVLRRLGRPAEPLARRWRRSVVKPLDRDLSRRTAAMREAHRLARIGDTVREFAPDLLVLGEGAAIELGVHFVPELLDHRPETVTAYAYERGAAA
ncbi:hypothetical protein AB0B28_07390 [Glycomyces sp. NPDC046736]|uniref:hypothetical protein n=1 Tax=Glycomyces sp. NPDC046736 TaxID=3155615 RepID=UPI0033ED1D3E